jgi:glycosyltransferase involved in cell wall biosynthesis
MKTAVFTVIYPEVKPFLPEFINSIVMQSDRAAELFIINDGVEDAEALFPQALSARIKDVPLGLFPAAIRKIGISWLAEENQDVIIFADADDYFALNRVEVSQKLLTSYDVVINELMLFGTDIIEPIPMLRERLQPGQEVTISQLLRSNCCGLSNTATYVDMIAKDAQDIPDQIKAFDWALYSKVLLSGKKAIFTSDTQTYYRQYSHNIAAPYCLSDGQIRQGVQIKMEHYRLLRCKNPWYEAQAVIFEELYKRIQEDVDLGNAYMTKIRLEAPQNPLWWEAIKTLEELGL